MKEGAETSSYKSSEGFHKTTRTRINGKDFTEERQSEFGHKRCIRLRFQTSHLFVDYL